MLDYLIEQYKKIMDNALRSNIFIDISLILGITIILINITKHFIK